MKKSKIVLHIADWCVCIMVAYFTEISPFLWKFCSCNNIFLFKTHFCSPLRRLYTVRKTFRTCQQISFFCCLTVLTLIKTTKAGGKLLFHLFLLFPNIFLWPYLFFNFLCSSKQCKWGTLLPLLVSRAIRKPLSENFRGGF